jgi:zinc transporter ZupT
LHKKDLETGSESSDNIEVKPNSAADSDRTTTFTVGPPKSAMASDSEKENTQQKEPTSNGVTLVLALSIHSIFEGISLGVMPTVDQTG